MTGEKGFSFNPHVIPSYMCQGGDCTAGDPSMEKFKDKNSVAEHAQNQILAAARLREYWKELLDLELSDTTDIISNKARKGELETMLSRGLVEFLHNDTVFSVKRLLPADP